MSYVHAFTALADIRDRSRDSISSQRALSSEAYPKVINHLCSHTIQPYQISANMPAASPEEQARLETTYSTRAQVSAGSHGFPCLGAPGYPISSSAVASHDDKNNSWATPNLPLSKCPYSPLSLFPCGSGKTADRGDKVSTLKSWLYEHRRNPYPTKGEKIMLAVITKMTLTQVSTWFANARRRLKKDSKTTLPALDRCKDDDDDDDRNDDSNEVEYHEASRGSTASNVKSRKSLSTHLSTDTEAEKITALKESIVQNNEHHVGDEDDDCKHEPSEDPSVNTDQNSPFMADSTQDLECSLPSNRPVLDAMPDSRMRGKLSAGEKQHRGQPPIKIRCGRSGRDLKHQASSSLPSKGSPSGEKQNTNQLSSREVSSSTCGRPKIWSVTDFINTPLSTKLTATSSLPTTTTAAATSTWYSSLPSASVWTSNSLNPLMTTAAMLPPAHPKTSVSQHHRSLSHEGIIHWPPSGSSPFARLTSPYQARSIPYPHASGRLAVPVSGQESTAAAGGQSWPALCLQTVYPMFPPRVVFSSP